MFRGGSIQFARILGIRIGVDPSWFFVLFLIIWSLSDYFGSNDLYPGEETKAFALAVISALLFFVSVLLHELGHALEARRSGIGIAGIDLWMFGGVAKMERDTRSAGEEFRVAIAGPVVTLLIALAAYLGATLIAGAGEAFDSAAFDASGGEAVAVLGYLASINALLLVFNLIPGFPLDGGRIARAIAWRVTGDRTRATRFAGTLGRGFSFVLLAVGAFLFLRGNVVGGIWMAIIGLFLGQAARSAVAQTEITSRIEGLAVSDVMDADPVAVPAGLSVDRAYDEFFLRYRWPWFPVVDAAGCFVGVLREEGARGAVEGGRPIQQVRELMESDDGQRWRIDEDSSLRALLDADGRLAGLVTQQSVEGLPDAIRPSRTVASVMATDAGNAGSSMRVDQHEPLETLLGREGLVRLGAIMAVDGDGRLQGIVSADDVRRALQGAPATI